MAKLTTTRTGADGARVHPVARVRVTIGDSDNVAEDFDIRFTLRSDGAILQSSERYGGGWSGHSIRWNLKPGVDVTAATLERIVGRRFPDSKVCPEALR